MLVYIYISSLGPSPSLDSSERVGEGVLLQHRLKENRFKDNNNNKGFSCFQNVHFFNVKIYSYKNVSVLLSLFFIFWRTADWRIQYTIYCTAQVMTNCLSLFLKMFLNVSKCFYFKMFSRILILIFFLIIAFHMFRQFFGKQFSWTTNNSVYLINI